MGPRKASGMEFYPDGFNADGKNIGPKVFSISFNITNPTRYKKMTKKERAELYDLITEFKARIEEIQEDLTQEPNTASITY